MVPPESRSYRSDLRARQAAQTRARVIAAAAEQFSSQGYQATTMAAIARAAAVSTETVKATASKAELLIAAFETAFSGTEAAGSLADTEAGAGLGDVDDAGFLDAVVGRVAAANARAHGLWTVLLGAGLSDPVVGEALDGMLARRRADFRMLVAELARRGLGAAGDDALADELSFLLSPEGYQQLVAQSGWSTDAYLAWLGARVRALVTA